jgi:hypothetical protein
MAMAMTWVTLVKPRTNKCQSGDIEFHAHSTVGFHSVQKQEREDTSHANGRTTGLVIVQISGFKVWDMNDVCFRVVQTHLARCNGRFAVFGNPFPG